MAYLTHNYRTWCRLCCAVCHVRHPVCVCEQDAADWGGQVNEGLGGEEVILDAQEGVYYGHAQRPAEMVRLKCKPLACGAKRVALFHGRCLAIVRYTVLVAAPFQLGAAGHGQTQAWTEAGEPRRPTPNL